MAERSAAAAAQADNLEVQGNMQAELADQRSAAQARNKALAELGEVQGNLHAELTEQRSTVQTELANFRKFLEAQKAELRQHLTDMSSTEREQSKSLLARARQILDSDEALRQKLQTLLAEEVVTRADFIGET